MSLGQNCFNRECVLDILIKINEILTENAREIRQVSMTLNTIVIIRLYYALTDIFASFVLIRHNVIIRLFFEDFQVFALRARY